MKICRSHCAPSASQTRDPLCILAAGNPTVTRVFFEHLKHLSPPKNWSGHHSCVKADITRHVQGTSYSQARCFLGRGPTTILTYSDDDDTDETALSRSTNDELLPIRPQIKSNGIAYSVLEIIVGNVCLLKRLLWELRFGEDVGEKNVKWWLLWNFYDQLFCMFLIFCSSHLYV